jgi:uncharacterized protein YjbI with pentapeptide repeats
MDPVVTSALISAGATVVGVGATAMVAIVGLRLSRSVSDRAMATGREANLAAVEAARASVQATLQNTRDGQIADLYGKAIEQLGSGKLDLRIGGIYALERIARDSARDHPTVIEVLSAFIREHSHEQSPLAEDGADPLERETRPDVQAAVTVIGRRDRARDVRLVDLHGASLARADLADADLSDADFGDTNLSEANLFRAVLTGANLTDTDLTGANLTEANLSGASLFRANLTGASLFRANLTGASLFRANLSDASLLRTNLSEARLGAAILVRACLIEADLTNAELIRTNLTSAKIVGAKLAGAKLIVASLIRADLTGADLTGADFTGADLTGADRSEAEHVPDGWRRDADTGRLVRAGWDAGNAPVN